MDDAFMHDDHLEEEDPLDPFAAGIPLDEEKDPLVALNEDPTLEDELDGLGMRLIDDEEEPDGF